MFNNILQQIIQNYAQAYYMLDQTKREGLDYYIKEQPDHRYDGERTLAATVYISNVFLHVVKVSLSDLDMTQLVSSEYDEYVYMTGSLFLIY
jgi:hypothetical protein